MKTTLSAVERIAEAKRLRDEKTKQIKDFLEKHPRKKLTK